MGIFRNMGKETKLVIITLLSWILLYLIYISDVANSLKVVASIIMFYIIGEEFYRMFKLDKEMVFLLWKNKKYLRVLEKLAEKFRNYFIIMADMSLFIAFGLFAFLIMKWRTRKERIILGGLGYLVLISIAIIYPTAISFLMVMLGVGSASASASSSYLAYIVFIIGIAPSAFLALFASSIQILIQLISLFSGEKGEVAQSVTLLLPGINIPFLEGILALIAILIVHEFSHGILALIGRIKVKSMGVVSFGSLPIGAFVEPDEKKMNAAPHHALLRVLVAGVSANFILALMSFLALMIFLYLTPSFAEPSCLVFSGNQVIHAKECTSSRVLLLDGTAIQIQDGMEYTQLSNQALLRYYPNKILSFIYNFLILSSSLNLVIAVINLIPIPYFDGDTLFGNILPKNLHNIVRYVALASLIISFIPGLL